jgi:hypothetical protein
MKDNAKVISVKNNKNVEVVPLITDTCIGSTNSSCTKQGKPFIVRNVQNLPIHQGSIVKIVASPAIQAIQAFFSLFLPLAAAFIGYLVTPKICIFFGRSKPITEATLIAGVLLFFCATSILIFIFNKLFKTNRYAIIREIVM